MNRSPETEQDRSAPASFLRRVARRPPVRNGEEYCELCNAQLAPAHAHLLHRQQRQIVCSCDSCALVFCGQPGAHYVRIPRRLRWLTGFEIPDMQWASMMIPIHLAFFYYDRAAEKITAMYPSPAGAIESLLSLEMWTEVAGRYPALAAMEPDVEALLVNRIGSSHQYFIVPMDECYRLVGLIRMYWRGLSGGAEVWKQINDFFTSLQARSTEVRDSVGPEATHA